MKQLVTNELERMQKVAVVAQPQVLFKHLPERAKKNENPQSGQTKFEPGNSKMKQKHNLTVTLCDIY